MRLCVFYFAVLATLPLAAQTPSAPSPDLAASVANQVPALTETYTHLHRTP